MAVNKKILTKQPENLKSILVKYNLLGYFALVILIAIILIGHLLNFFIFLLFIFLFNDVFINDVKRRFPAISRKLLFLVFYILLITVFFFAFFKIIPIFIKDLSKYSQMLEHEVTRLLNRLSANYNLEFNFSSIKEKIFLQGTESIKQFFLLFKGISKGFIYFIFAVVLNFLLITEKKQIEKIFSDSNGSLMAYLYCFIKRRIEIFYLFFKMVMSGQVFISLINSVFTIILVSALHLPNKVSLVFLVFICGLIPIIGNVISNTIISITALLTQGIIPCIISLAFLIAIHKFEYFLNSKIIGSIVKLPMFIMLFSLLIFESLIGAWGLILAIPAILFLKHELEHTFIPNL